MKLTLILICNIKFFVLKVTYAQRSGIGVNILWGGVIHLSMFLKNNTMDLIILGMVLVVKSVIKSNSATNRPG